MLVVKAFESKAVISITFTLFILYFVSMFIAPWFTTAFSWEKYQKVLYTWQSLNVGVLAFTASVIALSISRYNEEKKREREFTAAKAFLPQAISELCLYLNSCVPTYTAKMEVFRIRSENFNSSEPPIPKAPELPRNYASVFKESIKHASPEVGDYLVRILRDLQVHHSRSLEQTAGSKDYLLACIHEIGVLRARLDSLFKFARNEKEFSSIKPIDYEQVITAYNSLNLDLNSKFSTELINYTRFKFNAG
ncbi:hypothetical protein CWC05_03675 [Pseudoalteromonas ruthenica]|uniref:Uncharacterized protein n=1 Tax=Pseudoalteromonas ruthenica TaxID=151081 RepID=A0A5S3Z8G2_9GAMM|nr:hypothetical protein [Pseudoalteromonas ruthenica]TMP88542.1 hypothetical protein CWC05_03675 [Pseudoalteromonas ruthenica]